MTSLFHARPLTQRDLQLSSVAHRTHLMVPTEVKALIVNRIPSRYDPFRSLHQNSWDHRTNIPAEKPSNRDLLSVMLVDSTFRALAEPRLYEHIEFNMRDEVRSQELLLQCVEAIINKPSLALATRSLHCVATWPYSFPSFVTIMPKALARMKNLEVLCADGWPGEYDWIMDTCFFSLLREYEGPVMDFGHMFAGARALECLNLRRNTDNRGYHTMLKFPSALASKLRSLVTASILLPISFGELSGWAKRVALLFPALESLWICFNYFSSTVSSSVGLDTDTKDTYASSPRVLRLLPHSYLASQHSRGSLASATKTLEEVTHR